jgi:membrane protease YdiL (CAAX protease family)
VDDWGSTLVEISVYLGLAIAGALVFGALWRFTSLVRPPLLPLQRVRLISWQGGDVLLAFWIVYGIPVLVYVALRQTGFFDWLYGERVEPSTGEVDVLWLWSMLLLGPLALCASIVVLRRVTGARLAEMGLTPVRAGTNAAVGYAYWLVLTPLTLGLNFVAVLATPENWQELHSFTKLSQQDLAGSEWLLLIASATFLGPVLEEYLFRGVLLPWQLQGGLRAQVIVAFCALIAAALTNRYEAGRPLNPAPVLFVMVMLPGVFLVPLWQGRGNLQDGAFGPLAAVFTNGLFFAAMHSNAWPSPIPLLVLGIGLAWVTYRTSSLVPAVTIHALFNAVSAVALWLHGICAF